MRAGGNHRGARTICLGLVAGFIAFETILALSAGAVGIPGVLLIQLKDESSGGAVTQAQPASEGGESDFAKPSAVKDPPPQPPVAAEPASPVAPAGAPRLDGLADIPATPWIRDETKPDRPKAFSTNTAGREELPWDAVEPVPYPSEESDPADVTTSLPAGAPATPAAQAAPIELAASSEVESWVKAKATEVKGEYRARPLYHFEFWLEPPEAMKRSLSAVVYEFNTLAVMPQVQASSEQSTGFRISAGGLTCADKVTVTLRFRDGRKQQVAVDGCKLVDKDAA
jgi:hypothetical protein